MKPDNEMPLTDHLGELRHRIINSLYGIIGGALLCWVYSQQIFEFIKKPIEKYLPTGGLVFTGVMDKFTAHIKVAILSGVILSSPWWIYQVWLFISPGLYKKEKKYAVSFCFFGTILFLLGALMVYYIVFPMAFKYLLNFGGTQDSAMITIDDYLSFFLITIFAFGVSFELPLVLVVLAMLGVVEEKFLSSKRNYFYVLISIVSAVITPPDLISMMMLFVPLVLLYELSLIIIKFIIPKNTISEHNP